MKPKINEITVRFVECGECGYEKSFPLAESFKRGNFTWICPQCGHFWAGLLDEDGTLEVTRRGGERQAKFYSLIETDRPLNLHIVQATGRQLADDKQSADSDQKGGAEKVPVLPVILLLNAVAPDGEQNPRGFAQYEGREF